MNNESFLDCAFSLFCPPSTSRSTCTCVSILTCLARRQAKLSTLPPPPPPPSCRRSAERSRELPGVPAPPRTGVCEPPHHRGRSWCYTPRRFRRLRHWLPGMMTMITPLLEKPMKTPTSTAVLRSSRENTNTLLRRDPGGLFV